MKNFKKKRLKCLRTKVEFLIIDLISIETDQDILDTPLGCQIHSAKRELVKLVNALTGPTRGTPEH